MSVDKFGRRSNQPAKGLKGPKGDGFNLTSEGDFDIQNRRLRNVKNPELSHDAVNLTTLNSKSLLFDSKGVDVKNKKIRNVADPAFDLDAVNLQTLFNYSLSTVGNVFNARNKRVSNVGDAIDPNDAFPLRQLNNCIPTKDVYDNSYKFQDYKLREVGHPVKDNDAVTLSYFRTNSIKRKWDGWDFERKRIKLVADPAEMEDAVTLNYLIRVVSELFYNFYNRLAPTNDDIKITLKDHWIRTNIVDPFFKNQSTRIMRSDE